MKYVIKLGGSAITKKKETKAFPMNIQDIIEESGKYIRSDKIRKIGRTISSAKYSGADFSLILVNGVGPFGHYLVNERKNENMHITPNLVHQSVEHLNFRVAEELRNTGVKTVSVPPFNTCYFNGDYDISELWRITKAYMSSDMHLVPISYGDLVPTVGCKGKYFEQHIVISGDDIATKIAKEWNADKIIMITDVGGIYTTDPNINKNAKLVHRIVVDKNIEIDEGFRKLIQCNGINLSQNGIDVTSGMTGKTAKLCRFTHETGIVSQVCDVSGLENVLMEKTAGTVIQKQK